MATMATSHAPAQTRCVSGAAVTASSPKGSPLANGTSKTVSEKASAPSRSPESDEKLGNSTEDNASVNGWDKAVVS